VRLWRLLFIGFTISLAIALSAFAQNLSDAEVEKRAQEVGRSLRCVVCQGESIEESGADLAADMRKLVRRRIRAGDSNEQVMAYMRARYGDYVLLKPPVQKNTYILWFSPFLALILAFVVYIVKVRQRPTLKAPETLSPKEQEKLARLLEAGNRDKEDGT